MKVDLKLPSLHALLHFEAAARLGSFKAAAEELHLSQGAVSLQIRGLEQALGKKLFVRQVRKVVLTEEGRELSEVVSQSLVEISAVWRRISSAHEDGSIKIELGPFISSRWLSPRLGRFVRRYRSIQLQLVHNVESGACDADTDIAIRYGAGRWRSFEAYKLMDLFFQPVATPDIAALLEGKVFQPSEALPLIHARSRADWEAWLGSAGLPVEWARSGMVFDDTNVALEAAASGAGIALGYFPLVDEDVRSKRLVPIHPHRERSQLAYYALVRPSAAKSSRPVRRFLAWLRTESAPEAQG